MNKKNGLQKEAEQSQPGAKRLLLAFDGSAQSLNAAELCWDLAANHPIAITAQHVVNTVGVWQLLDFQLPGLTGSGPYLAAREAIIHELRKIGETLLSIYQTKATGKGLAENFVLDEGDALSEILRRSNDADLVVIGHHPFSPQSDSTSSMERSTMPRSIIHSSLAESLARVIDKPLLIVQGPITPWQRVELILHGDLGVDISIRSTSALADFLSLPLAINAYVKQDETYTDLPNLSKQLKETEKNYPDLEVHLTRAKLWPLDGNDHLAQVPFQEGSLVIVPTLLSQGERWSIFGTAPELFVRYSSVPSLLFLPIDLPVLHAINTKSAASVAGAHT